MARTRYECVGLSAFLTGALLLSACNDMMVSPTDVASPPIERTLSSSASELVACIATEPDPPSISIDESVVVNAGCSLGVGPGATFLWELGDGRIMTGPRVEARYGRRGEYVVELTVEEQGMRSTATTRVEVIFPPPSDPTACFTFRRLGLAETMLPCSMLFDASCSRGEIREYRWFFGGSPHIEGDDETVTTLTPEVRHSWAANMECRFFRPFERLVRLTTVDSRGKTASVEQTIPFAHVSRE